jgi:hypothetical protein
MATALQGLDCNFMAADAESGFDWIEN